MSLLTLLFPGGLNGPPVNVTSTFRAQASSMEVPATTLPGTVQAVQVGQTFTSTFKSSGTAADSVDRVYVDTLAFVPNTPQVLDLTALVDLYGTTRSFARVRRLSIKFKDTNDGDTLTLGYATTTANAWTSLLSNPGTLTLQACTAANDGFAVFSAPNTSGWVVGSSNKLLKLDPGGAGFTVDIEILGASQ